VLLDPTRGGRGSWQVAVGEQFGIDASQLDGALFRRHWADILVGTAPIEPALERAIDALGWPCSVEELLAAWFESDFFVNGQLVQAAFEWVEGGSRLILVTNQEHRRAAFLRERFTQVLPPFVLYYSAGIGQVKSDPDFFDIVDAELGTSGSPGSVVLVDDTLGNITTAQLHGWRAVHFTGQPEWEADISEQLAAAALADGRN
jgi:putative hydrolase of the HAD superfamily